MIETLEDKNLKKLIKFRIKEMKKRSKNKTYVDEDRAMALLEVSCLENILTIHRFQLHGKDKK
jgi:hypothetical protein